MATVTVTCSKDASAIANPDGTTYTYDWNGFDSHHPVGAFSASYKGRSLVYFPISFSGWTAVNSATMYMRVTSYHAPFGGSTKTLRVARHLKSWTEQAGSENSWTNASGANNTYTAVDTAGTDYTTTNQVSKSVGSLSDNTWVAFTVTALVDDIFNNGSPITNNGFLIYNGSSETSTSYYAEFATREVSGSAPYIVIDYSTNTAPNAPTNLSPTASNVINSLTPTLSGSFSDPDAGDILSAVNYVVYQSDGTTVVYDSGYIAASGQSFSTIYAGPALTGNTTYKWKARVKDAAGAAGAFSALQTFVVNSVPSAPTVTVATAPSNDLKTLTPSITVQHNDADASDSMKAYDIVWKDSGGTTLTTTSATGLSTASVTVAYPGTPTLAWGTSYLVTARTTDQNNAVSSYATDKSFTTHATGAPISLSPSGGATASSIAPTFTGSRSDAAESLTSVQILVYANDETTLIWDSGTVTTGVTATGFSVGFAGTTLSYSTTYKWKVRATSSVGGTSAYSTFQSFVTPAAGAITQVSPLGAAIASLTPTFEFSRTNSFNAYQLIVYAADQSTVVFDSSTVTHSSVTSKTYAYAGATALTWNTAYYWKVRVSSDSGSTWGAGYSGVSGFTTDAAGVPTLTAPADNGWIATLTPTFSGSTYNSENATAYRILLYASDQTTLVWDSGDLSQTSATSFSKVYNGATALTAGSRYYWQARYTKSTGPTGGYSALRTFKVNSAPSPSTALTPSQNAILIDTSATPNPEVRATFSDADEALFADYPTAFEAEISRDSDGVVMYTMSKTASLVAGENALARSASGVTTSAGAGGTTLAYDTVYRVRVRYTDSKSEVGAWTSANQFKITKIPVTSITSPTSSVSSPIVQVNWTFTSPGSKSQAQYRLRALQSLDDTVVYDTGVVVSSSATATIPNGYIKNNTGYHIEVTTYDTDLIASVADVETVTASWTPPAAVEGFSITLD